MDKFITVVGGVLPTLIKNTHFNLSLSGWPAATTVIAICCSGTAIYSINRLAPATTK